MFNNLITYFFDLKDEIGIEFKVPIPHYNLFKFFSKIFL